MPDIAGPAHTLQFRYSKINVYPKIQILNHSVTSKKPPYSSSSVKRKQPANIGKCRI